MRVIILLTLVGAVFARNVQPWDPPTRIVGGAPTTVEHHPYIANLNYLAFGIVWIPNCAGTLITRKTILTASHCVHGHAPTSWRVRLGTSLRTSGGVIYLVSRIITHESYNTLSPLDNDVAILHIHMSALLSESTQIARIAGPNYHLPDGTVTTAAGWGLLTGEGGVPEQLHHVNVTTINQQLCKERYAYLKTQPGFEDNPEVTDSMFCAGALDVGGKDACSGDSGGPLVHQGDIVVGVISWGQSCADPVYPGVYARVSYLSNWIVEHATA